MGRVMLLVKVAAPMAAMPAHGGVAWTQSTAQPVDPPSQADRSNAPAQ